LKKEEGKEGRNMPVWNEADHPRDEDGKFTYKNGGASTSSISNVQDRADILYPTMKNTEAKADYNFNGLGNYKNENLSREDLFYPTMRSKTNNGKFTGAAASFDNSANNNTIIDNTIFSDNALKKSRSFITKAEDFKPNAYQDTAGIWTIGYGHTGDVKPGDKITLEQAENLYRKDFREHTLPLKDIKTPLSDNEKVALASLIYNIGGPQFKTSTTYKKLLEGDKKAAADAFLLFNKVTKKQNINGKIVPVKVFSQGLYNRRLKERELFLTPDDK